MINEKKFTESLLLLHSTNQLDSEELVFITSLKTTEDVYKYCIYFYGLSNECPFNTIKQEEFFKIKKISVNLFNKINKE